MSDEAGDTQYFSPDYKEGDLQIVEVTPFDSNDEEMSQGNSDGAHILPEVVCEDRETRYMMETENGPMELDLMNLTFVRCEDSEDTFQLQIAGVEADADAEAEAETEAGAGPVTCVLRADSERLNQYTVMSGDKEQVIILTAEELVNGQPEAKEAAARPASQQEATSNQGKPTIPLTPYDILEKRLQKARAAMVRQHARSSLNCGSRGGRKRRGAGGGRGAGGLPSPRELLAAPNFRLYLYACKLCDYRCNALRELREHKAAQHASSGGRSRAGGAGRAGQPLQCARCPYRAAHHMQLMKHVKEAHTLAAVVTVESEEEGEGEGEDGGVCSLCGHEAASRRACREHMAKEHS